MPKRLQALPIALAALGVAAPTAHAATDVVSNPAPGVASVRLSDSDDPGKLLIRVTTSSPIALDHFSALFLDLDRDGDGDKALVAMSGAGGVAVQGLATPQSTDACQQFAGATAAPVAGATATVASDLSSYTVKLPVSQISAKFDWKTTATAPGIDDLCGGTDGAVVGLATTLGGARTFTSDAFTPPDTTPPATPTGLTATAENGAIVLAWSANAEADLDSYLVYRRVVGGGFTLLATLATAGLRDTAVVNGVTYEYYVRAKDNAGNLSPESARVTMTARSLTSNREPTEPGRSGTDTGNDPGAGGAGAGQNPPTTTIRPIPAAPRRPKVLRVTARRVYLDWLARKGVVRYRVYRRKLGRAWAKKPLATVRRTAYVDKKVKPRTRYLYRIVGVTADGRLTKPSRSIAVTTKRAPGRRR